MKEKKSIITESQIEEIKYYLKNHSTISIKNIINQLKNFEEDEEVIKLRNKIKKENE